MLDLGYKHYCTHTFNSRVIKLARFGDLTGKRIDVDVSNMFIEET